MILLLNYIDRLDHAFYHIAFCHCDTYRSIHVVYLERFCVEYYR